ncbi:sulfite exporter TauE/SafE family protein [Pseudodesulfovibrio methanolicus]|uniref:Probable membrane transporter protein n=1 Tax=Pseudodesulfovibrio methanolicus TaxID=3126690 RepID=A0ABZ2J0Z5_9BACT
MTLIVFTLSWCIAGFVNHVVGLGAAMVAMPIVVHFLPLELAVPSSTLIVLVLNLQLAWNHRRSIRWQHLAYVFIGGVLGVVGGIFLIRMLNNDWLKALMGAFLIAYALYALFFEKREPRHIHPLWAIPTGICSTFFGTAFGFNGPPLAVFSAMSGWSADEAKGFLGASFILSGIAIVCGQFLAGLQTTQTLSYFLAACPASLLGGLFGIKFSRRFAAKSNRRLLLCVLLFAGISQIMGTFQELIK